MLLNFAYTISGVIGTSFRMGGPDINRAMNYEFIQRICLSLSDSITQPSDVVRSLIGNLH